MLEFTIRHVTRDKVDALYRAPESSDNFRISIEFGSFIFIGYVSGILPGFVHMFFSLAFLILDF